MFGGWVTPFLKNILWMHATEYRDISGLPNTAKTILSHDRIWDNNKHLN